MAKGATSCLCTVTQEYVHSVRINSPVTHLLSVAATAALSTAAYITTGGFLIVWVSARVKQRVKQVLQAEHQTSV